MESFKNSILFDLYQKIIPILNIISKVLIHGLKESISKIFINRNFIRSFCSKHPWRDDRNIWISEKFSVFTKEE